MCEKAMFEKIFFEKISYVRKKCMIKIFFEKNIVKKRRTGAQGIRKL